MALGQLTSQGGITAWLICPLFQGLLGKIWGFPKLEATRVISPTVKSRDKPWDQTTSLGILDGLMIGSVGRGGFYISGMGVGDLQTISDSRNGFRSEPIRN